MALSASTMKKLGLDRPPLNERDRLRQEVYRRLAEHGRLMGPIDAAKLAMVIMQSWGWSWNVEEIGRALVHEGTRHEDYSALAGFTSCVAALVDDYLKICRG